MEVQHIPDTAYLVACIDVCKGISTEELKQLASNGGVSGLLRQRSEAMKLVREASEAISMRREKRHD